MKSLIFRQRTVPAAALGSDASLGWNLWRESCYQAQGTTWLCSFILPLLLLAQEASTECLQLSVAGTVKKKGGERKGGGMWPPSDPEMMLSASSDKAEITYCSVWAVAIVSAPGMTEGSKENPSIWCSISPYPCTSLCFYLLISLKAFGFFFPSPRACLVCTFFCWLVLAPVLQGLFSNALRNYFLFFYKQNQKSLSQPRHPSSAEAAGCQLFLVEAAASKAGIETPCVDPQLTWASTAPSPWHGAACGVAPRECSCHSQCLFPSVSLFWFPLLFRGSIAVNAAII